MGESSESSENQDYLFPSFLQVALLSCRINKIFLLFKIESMTMMLYVPGFFYCLLFQEINLFSSSGTLTVFDVSSYTVNGSNSNIFATLQNLMLYCPSAHNSNESYWPHFNTNPEHRNP
jgi:hypothetical protein